MLRGLLAACYAAPAAYTAYYAVYGVASLSAPAEVWRQTFAVVGAVVIGATA